MERPYKIKRLTQNPLIILKICERFQLDPDVFNLSQELIEILESVETPHYLLLTLATTNIDLDSVILGANYTTREGTPYLRHQNMRQMLLVAPEHLWQNSKNLLVSTVSGAARIRIFASDEDAREYLQERGISY